MNSDFQHFDIAIMQLHKLSQLLMPFDTELQWLALQVIQNPAFGYGNACFIFSVEVNVGQLLSDDIKAISTGITDDVFVAAFDDLE